MKKTPFEFDRWGMHELIYIRLTADFPKNKKSFVRQLSYKGRIIPWYHLFSLTKF